MKLTQHDLIVRHLFDVDDWVPAHELCKLNTRHGYIGNAGDVRARELARDEDCPDRLKGKVEREEGKRLGLDPRFVYFRFKRPVARQAALEN